MSSSHPPFSGTMLVSGRVPFFQKQHITFLTSNPTEFFKKFGCQRTFAPFLFANVQTHFFVVSGDSRIFTLNLETYDTFWHIHKLLLLYHSPDLYSPPNLHQIPSKKHQNPSTKRCFLFAASSSDPVSSKENQQFLPNQTEPIAPNWKTKPLPVNQPTKQPPNKIRTLTTRRPTLWSQNHENSVEHGCIFHHSFQISCRGPVKNSTWKPEMIMGVSAG